MTGLQIDDGVQLTGQGCSDRCIRAPTGPRLAEERGDALVLETELEIGETQGYFWAGPYSLAHTLLDQIRADQGTLVFDVEREGGDGDGDELAGLARLP